MATGRVVVVCHTPTEGPAVLGELLAAAGREVVTVRSDLGEPLPEPAGLGGVVCMGGPQNVDEPERWPFLETVVDWLGAVVPAGVPTIGVCLGGQLVAAALGATVAPGPRFEMGWLPLAVTSAGRADPVVGHFAGGRPTLQWHGRGFSLPEGCRNLAGTPSFPVQAFRAHRALALQFHPEVDARLLESWLSDPGAEPEIAAAGWTVPALREHVAAGLAANAAHMRAACEAWVAEAFG